MNYISLNIPTDYINRLINGGVKGRLKAQAFLTYLFDRESRNHKNSVRFYSESWNIGKSTVHRWIAEFRYEIEKFDTFWSLKNIKQDRSVKKSVGQMGHFQWDNRKENKSHKIELLKDREGQNIKSKWDKDIIYNDDDANPLENEFKNIFLAYSINNGFTGNQEMAFEEFKKIRLEIDIEDLLKAISLYLNDSSVDKKYNIANFLKNRIYLKYIDIKIKMFSDGDCYIGRYSKDKEIFYNSNIRGILTKDNFNEKLLKGEIIILGRDYKRK